MLTNNINENSQEEIIYNRRWIILVVVLLGTLMATLDSSIVNVALPYMASELSVGLDTIQWVVTSYLIVISAFVLIFGRIADIIGKSLVYQYGFLLFTFGSLLCGISKTVGFLVISRIIQAVGAAMTMSSNQGIIAATFPQNERGRALGLSATTVAVGTMLGPPIGGIMVELFSWQSIFLINIPIGILGYLAGRKVLPREEKRLGDTSFDMKGAVVFIIFIVSLFWAMLSGEKLGWSNHLIFSSAAISLISMVLFYFIEKNTTRPMLEFSMFENKLFDLSIFCAFVSFVAIFCNNIIQPFYLEYIMNINPAKAGMLMMIFPISAGSIAPVSGYLSDKIGSEILTILGLFFTTTGLILVGFLNTNSTYFDIVIRVAILGLGNGLFQSPNNAIVMSLVPRDKLGIAGSINALVRNMGMVFGIAFSVALLYNRMSAKIGYRVTSFVTGRHDVFIYAMRVVYMAAASICAVGMILTVVRMIKRSRVND
ncbi:MFS transporter [Clostridiaceae bacterium UIB06]|uniref:MFS transporter n=1 Tax=Clostridium thailandense TaxID=2794346 RepID=A0A949TT88_9CLOT|nr:MFS transporter [Clostridium thailandense]MBV7272951.1 MFS transporter [Clostridium thailandense]MCH5136238.1 MFS transporter [Clostridiaceae bacterium UIB06]